MKKILLYLFFLISFTCDAQVSWNTIIMESGTCPQCFYLNMIKTIDEGFVLPFTIGDGSGGFPSLEHRIVKYDENGDLVWDKAYNFGATSAGTDWGGLEWGGGRAQSTLLELDNGDLVMNGQYLDADTSFYYFFKTDSEGDSLLFRGYGPDYPFFRGRMFLSNDGEIYGIWEDDDFRYLLHLDENGEVLSENIIDEYSLQEFVVNNDALLTSRTNSTETIFRKFSLNGGLVSTFSFDHNYGRLIIPNEIGGITGYSKGLIKLDANLEEVWHTPIEDLFISMGSLDYEGFAITATPDGGYILAGHARLYTPDDAFVYLVKVDENGEREWGGLYSQASIGLNFIFDVEPVDDGYVFTGASLTTGLMWLAKVNSEGVFVSTEELVFQEEEVVVFPNPASEVVNLRWPEYASGILNLYGPSAQLLGTHSVLNQKEYVLLVDDLMPGIYTVHLMDENRKGLVFRFVKI